ncbi:MAG: hypothetical protein ACXABY_26820 [Candidatus Thorarchaeota archaeon]|jgi:hypothetical protein
MSVQACKIHMKVGAWNFSERLTCGHRPSLLTDKSNHDYYGYMNHVLWWMYSLQGTKHFLVFRVPNNLPASWKRIIADLVAVRLGFTLTEL